ncbi:MAG: hypothetical protein LBH24_04515 [Clostridiales bacterium]|jgi:hypothetical protein|nr:hypothetical protein [Clostridiales bacterium]
MQEKPSENQPLEDYRYLTQYFKLADIENRLRFWAQKINLVLTTMGLEDKVCVNNDLLHRFILDYFADIARLKDFHKTIKRVSVKKIVAYSVYWFLRRKPVQIIGPIDEKNIYINEKIALTVTLSTLEANGMINGDIDESFLTHFYYHLRYRVFTPQTLEIMIDAMMRGHDLYPVRS